MFDRCSALTKLDITNFDMTNVTNFNTLFNGGYGEKLTSTTVEIITNKDTAEWFNTNFPSYSNIKIVERTISKIDIIKENIERTKKQLYYAKKNWEVA